MPLACITVVSANASQWSVLVETSSASRRVLRVRIREDYLTEGGIPVSIVCRLASQPHHFIITSPAFSFQRRLMGASCERFFPGGHSNWRHLRGKPREAGEHVRSTAHLKCGGKSPRSGLSRRSVA